MNNRSLVLACLGILGVCASNAAKSQSVSSANLFKAGKFKEAEAHYTRLHAKNPNDEGAAIGLLRTDLRLDRWQSAVNLGAGMVATFPNSADIAGLYSMALMRAGKPEDASQWAAAGRHLNARSYWALVASSRVDVWQSHLDRAVQEAEQAVKEYPGRAAAMYYLLDAQSARDIVPATMPANAMRYFALRPLGHPHDFVMRALPGRMPIMEYEVIHPPFQVIKPVGNESPRNETSITFPFKMVGGSIVLSCKIDGVPAQLLFDTGGGSDITLNDSVALKLKAKPMAHSVVYGVSGYEPVDIYMAKTFTVGNATLGPVAVEGVKKGVPGSFDGILGGAAFLSYSVTIDFHDHVIHLVPGATTAPPAALPGDKLFTVPFNILEGDVVVHATIQGHDGYFIVDTGDDEDGTLAAWLGSGIASAMKPSAYRVINLNARVGLGTTATAQQIRLFNKPLSVELASDTGTTLDEKLIPSLAANLVDTQISPADDFEMAGLIGIGVVRRFTRVTIDYVHGLLTLELPSATKAGQ